MAGRVQFLAFIATPTAIKVLPIVAVHLLNAPKSRMGGHRRSRPVRRTRDPMLLTGIVLTMVGCFVLRKRPNNLAPCVPSRLGFFPVKDRWMDEPYESPTYQSNPKTELEYKALAFELERFCLVER